MPASIIHGERRRSHVLAHPVRPPVGRAKVNDNFSHESKATELYSQGHEKHPKQKQGAIGDRMSAYFFHDEGDPNRPADRQRHRSDQTEEA